MVLKINIILSEETNPQADSVVTEHEVCVSEELSSVSKSNMETIITKMAQVLDAPGISCFRCPGMKKNQEERNIADNPLYHDTWKLLKKYRDVVWSLELSVQQVRSRFEIEYGSSIEDFLESVYVAGIDLSDRGTSHHAKCIERSHRMLKLLDTSIDLLRTKHKNEENYYWLLYYTFLSPQ